MNPRCLTKARSATRLGILPPILSLPCDHATHVNPLLGIIRVGNEHFSFLRVLFFKLPKSVFLFLPHFIYVVPQHSDQE